MYGGEAFQGGEQVQRPPLFEEYRGGRFGWLVELVRGRLLVGGEVRGSGSATLAESALPCRWIKDMGIYSR